MDTAPLSESRSINLKHTLRDRTFRSLRHRNYRLYFLGQSVSFIGSWIQTTALMWLSYETTNDPAWPAYLMVAQVGPTLLLGPFGGTIADRFSKRSIILATQFAFMLNALALALIVGLDVFSPALLLGMQFVGGVIQGIDLPTRLAVVTELVPREDVMNAVGLNSLLFNTARAAGPALAGLIFLATNSLGNDWSHLPSAQQGALVCFLLNAVSYLAVLWALARIQSPEPASRTDTKSSFWDGVRYLWSHPGLAGLVLLTGCFCVFAWPILTLFPAYTKLVLGRAEGSYSLLLSSFGGGALVGALATATYGSLQRRPLFLMIGGGIGWLGLLLLAIVNTLPLAMIACLFLGFGMVLYLSTGQSTLQTSVPNEVRGRVMAIWAMMLSASSLPGHLSAGALARSLAVSDVLLIMFLGVGITLGCLGLLLVTRPFPHPEPLPEALSA